MRRGGVWYELAHDRLVAPIHDDNEDWERRHEFAVESRRRKGWKATALGFLALGAAAVWLLRPRRTERKTSRRDR